MGLANSDLFKKCFGCKKTYPLFMYGKTHPKDYQLKSDKGRLTECRVCEYKRNKKEGGKLHPYLKETKSIGNVRRFTFIEMTKKQSFIYSFLMTNEGRKSYARYKLNKQNLKPYNE